MVSPSLTKIPPLRDFLCSFTQLPNFKEPLVPKNEVADTITDQEIAFACLILSGTMTDERAAEAVGLNPATAAYIKSKPCVRAYLLEHQARMQQKLAAQQTGSLPHFHLGREKVLDRLWEICIIGPEITRGSLTSQVKAISMIVAIEGLIPDRRAGSAQTNSPAPKAEIYESEWMEEQRLKAAALVHAQEDPEKSWAPRTRTRLSRRRAAGPRP